MKRIVEEIEFALGSATILDKDFTQIVKFTPQLSSRNCQSGRYAEKVRNTELQGGPGSKGWFRGLDRIELRRVERRDCFSCGNCFMSCFSYDAWDA